jgi:hypothetical protein
MNMLDINLKAFTQDPDSLKEQLQKQEVPLPYEIIPSKQGGVTFALGIEDNKKKLIHSKYDPVKEASRAIPTNRERDPDIVILGGFGFGYQAEAVLQAYPKAQVVAWEKEVGLFRLALEARDLRSLLTNPRFQIIAGEDFGVLIELLKTYQTRNISLINHRPLFEIFSEYYTDLRERIYAYLNSRDINVNTLNRFQKLWTRNLLNNLTEFVGNRGIAPLAKQFQGVPCVIVAGGPSLNKNIKLLSQVQNRGLIIACNTVLQPLLRNQIEPDLVIAVDPQDILEKYFRNTKLDKAYVVCEPSVSNKIVRKFPGKIVMVSSLFSLAKWLEQFGPTKGEIEIGGSVATGAYGLAQIMGCDPIVFVGQDLAYTNNKFHTKGTFFEQGWIYETTRFCTLTTTYFDLMKRVEPFETEGYYEGERVLTDRKFEMFKWWFESRFGKTDRTIVDATEGGCSKKHCKKMTFQEALDTYFTTPLEFELETILGSTQDEWDQHRVVEELQLIIQELDALIRRSERAKQLAHDLYRILYNHHVKGRDKPQRVNRILEELDELDQNMIPQRSVMEFISLTIQKIIHAIQDDTDQDFSEIERAHEPLMVARRSIMLYEELYESATYNSYIFNKVVGKLHILLESS